jgi:hypothetical protein
MVHVVVVSLHDADPRPLLHEGLQLDGANDSQVLGQVPLELLLVQGLQLHTLHTLAATAGQQALQTGSDLACKHLIGRGRGSVGN